MLLAFSVLFVGSARARNVKAEPSLSQEYLDNPENFYRNPCPTDRPGGICNAMDEYVWRKDPNYKWELRQTITDYKGITGYTFYLTSQQWLDDRYYKIRDDGSSIWKHWAVMWVPNDKIIDRELMDTAFMLIDGGKNGNTPPSMGDSMVQYGRFFTSVTGSIFITLKQIPNEPLIFTNDWKSSR